LPGCFAGAAMKSPHDRKNVWAAPLGPEHVQALSCLKQSLRELHCQAVNHSAKTSWIAAGFVGDCLHGFLEIHSLDDPHLWSASVLVEPDWRGLGLGTELLQAGIAFAKSSRRTTLRLVFPRHDWRMRKLVSKADARLDIVLDELSADISLLGKISGSHLHQKGRHHD
jgi:GNAT superfamily N-acetyltransferase